MKEAILLIMTILLLSYNSENKKNETTVNDIINVEAENSEIIADTSFLDFFEKYMWDRDFQKSRVIHPIQLNGKEIKNSEEWKYLPFYTQSDCIPTLASDTLSIFDKSINLQSIKMFIVDFKKDIAESFSFEKVNKNWFLKNSDKTTFANLPDLDFISFLTKFSNDSIFQIKSILYALEIN